MLGDEDVFLSVNHEAIHLRPTLRAALRLVRKYGDLQSLAGKLDEMSFVAVSDVIRECSVARSDLLKLLKHGEAPFGVSLQDIAPRLMPLVLGFAGVDSDDKPSPRASTGKPVTMQEHLTRLFGLATGAVGWPPEAAWQATPAEIIAAYTARVDLLASIFGGSKEDDAAKSDPMNDRLDEEGLAALAGMGRAF